jgi:hypothetical protein
MRAINSISTYLIALIIALSLWSGHVSSGPKELSQTEVVATWVERLFDKYTIKTSQKDQSGKWSEIDIAHISKNQINSATILTRETGQQFLFWSETDHNTNEQIIMYKTRLFDQSEWSLPRIFYEDGSENIGISLLRRNQEIWVFWASTAAELPDIYYKVYSAGNWSREQLAHEANDVPDFKPTASLANNGQVMLSWLSFDLDKGDYVYKEEVISQALDSTTLSDKIDDLNVELPSFIPPERSISLRFPNNDLNQSISVDRSMGAN